MATVTHTIKYRVLEIDRGLLIEPDRIKFYSDNPFRYPFDTEQEALDALGREQMYGEFVILPVTKFTAEGERWPSR